MRTMLGFLALGVAALAVAAPEGSKALADYIKTIGSADTLHSRYSVQPVGGAPAYYTVDLKKPNQARIDSPTRTIVADGTTITTFDKSNNIFSKRPQTDLELSRIFAADDLYIWSGFYNPSSAAVFLSKDRGTTDVEGTTLNIVETAVDRNGRRGITFYFSPADKLVRLAQMDVELPNGKSTSVVTAREIAAGTALDTSTFTYSNTTGAKEVSWEDMLPLRWISDMKEAIRQATAANKKILIDFYAPNLKEWQKLDAEVYKKQDFRQYAKKLILVRIDTTVRRRNNNNSRTGTTQQDDPVQTYGVQKAPTEIVCDKTGTVIDSTVGYTDADTFNAFLKAATAN